MSAKLVTNHNTFASSTGLPGRLDVPPKGGFVGRDAELTQLADAAASAASALRVALVAGEPGAGKTSLVGEFARRVADDSSAIAYGRCDEDLAIPYQPWREVVRFLLSRWGDRVGGTVERHAHTLGHFLPEVVPPARRRSASDSRLELFDAVAEVVAAAGDAEGRRPAIVVLDDLHWADQASVLLLRHVIATAPDAAVLVIAMYRPTDIEFASPVGHLLTALSREPASSRVDLVGLRQGDIEMLVERRLGHALDGREQRWARQLWHETAGNPLFATAALDVGDHGPDDSPTVPASVRELVTDRIATLGPNATNVLGTAGVIGEEFDASVLAEVVDLPRDELSLLLDAAARRGLLVPIAERDGFRFAHALVARAAAAGIGPAVRKALHGRVADVLEARAGAVSEFSGAIARHRLASDVRDERDGRAVIAALLSAGVFASEAHAYEDAVETYRRALETAMRWNVNAELRAEVLWRLGAAQRAAGDPRGGHDILLEAALVAAEAGRWDLVAEAIADTPYLPSPTADDNALATLETLRALVPTDAAGARALVLAKISFARHYSATVDELEDLAREAVEAAIASGDVTAISHATGARFRALYGSPDIDERLRIADDAVRGLAPGGRFRATTIAEARRARMMVRAQAGNIAEFDHDLHDLNELAARVRQPEVQYFAANLQAVRASVAGELALAEELGAQAVATAGSIVEAQNGYGVLLLTHAFYRGQLGLLADMIAAATTTAPYSIARSSHTAALAAAGRRTEAAAALDELAADRYAAIRRDDLWLPSATMLGEACRDLAAGDHAATLHRELEPYAGQFAVVGGALFGVLGAVDRTLGITAAIAGDAECARSHLEVAVGLNAKAGHRPALAMSLADLAWLLATSGAPDADVQGAIAEARDRATELGLTGILERLERLVRTDIQTAELRQDGDIWIVGFGDRSITMQPLRGLTYLRHLVANPGVEIGALELQTLGIGGTPSPTRPTQPVLDDDAKRAYRRRIADLDDEILEAERYNDQERAARLSLERETVVKELIRAAGLGGRDRALDTENERARLNVSRAIRTAIDRIASNHPPIAAHLSACVRTGNTCSYQPDPNFPIRWST